MAFRRRPGGLPYNRRTPVIAADQPASNAAGSEYVFGIHSSALYNSQHTGFIVKASAGFQGPSVSQFTAGPQNQDLTLQAQIFKALQPFSNAPGSEYIFGTHALAIYAQSQGTVFPAAATPTVVVSFAVKFVSAGPQGADLSLQAQIEQSAPGYQGPSIKPLQAAPQSVDLTLSAQIEQSSPGYQGSTVRQLGAAPQPLSIYAADNRSSVFATATAVVVVPSYAVQSFVVGPQTIEQPQALFTRAAVVGLARKGTLIAAPQSVDLTLSAQIKSASGGYQGPTVKPLQGSPLHEDLTLQAQIKAAAAGYQGPTVRQFTASPQPLSIYAADLRASVYASVGTPPQSYAVQCFSAGPQNVDLTLAAQIRPSVPGYQGSTVRAFTVVPQTPEVLAAVSVPAALGSTSSTAALTGALATFSAGNVSLNQPAGRHHKRYAVRHGWRLYIYDSKAHADAARRKHKKKKVLPKPLEVIELETVKEVAKARGVLRQVESLLETQQYIEVVSLHKRLMQMREEEEIALTMLFDYSPSEQPYDEEELAVALLLAA